EPPPIKRPVFLTPFGHRYLKLYSQKSNLVNYDLIESYFGQKHTVFPHYSYALRAMLQQHQIRKNDQIVVLSSLGSPDLSPTITHVLNQLACRVTKTITTKTKMVV